MAIIGLFVLVYLGATIIGVLIGWGLVFAVGGAAATNMAQSPWAIVLAALAYVGIAQLFGVVLRIYTQQRVWKLVVSACRLRNPQHLASAGAAGIARSALGEGLADGLDVTGF